MWNYLLKENKHEVSNLTNIMEHHYWRCDWLTVIQLDQNQFRTVCLNRNWFFQTFSTLSSDSARPNSVPDILSKWQLVFWNFLGQIIKARKSLYCGFSSGWGLASLSPFPLQNSVWSLDFGMKNVNFCCILGGMFLCNVMSSPLQNHKCNASHGVTCKQTRWDEGK